MNDQEMLVRKITSRILSVLEKIPERDSSLAFTDVGSAVATVARAQQAWQWEFSLDARIRIIEGLRSSLIDDRVVEELSALAVEETGMGRVADKIAKKRIAIRKTPGPEDFRPNAITGDHGLALEELSPFGVIASITPSTNPVASIINNVICMISGGNGVVFAPHPGALRTSIRTIEYIARALELLGAPAGLAVTLAEPSMENLSLLMSHPTVRLIAATGGPGVVNAALRSGKPAIGAGPGNPPVLVDETADLRKAAKDVILGCSFDNNLPCISEKELFVVNCVADELKQHMLETGLAYELKSAEDVKKLLSVTLTEKGTPDKSMVGKNASFILDKIGHRVPENVRLILVETGETHPLVQEEMLMPILPLVRVADFEDGLAASLRAEHGFHHSAVIHSTNINHMSIMARAMETTIFTKNAPSYVSLGYEGDSPTSFTIATTTGQGPTTPRSFCRLRRCILSGSFRIV